MTPLQPQTTRDFFQRLAELQEVQDDLSPETLVRRVGAIVDGIRELARANPDRLATELQDLDAALAHLKPTGRATPLLKSTRPPAP